MSLIDMTRLANWGRALDAAADERLTRLTPALGNRENAANVSDRPQSDLFSEAALAAKPERAA